MERKMHEPFMMRKHADLQNEVNELIIAIKAHHTFPDERMQKPEQWEKLQSMHPVPKWEDIIDILNRCYRALDEQKFNPVKY